MSYLTIDGKLSDDYDCGSAFFTSLVIEDKEYIKRLNGRYYYNEEENHLDVINSETDDHLIGREIFLRSPISCCSENGICEVCYGKLYKVNKIKDPDQPDLNIGLIGTIILTNQMTQALLSTKHLLQAQVDKVLWDEKFLDYFMVAVNNIYIKEFRKFKLIIDKKDLIESEYMRDENHLIFNKFKIQFGKDEPIEFTSPIDLQTHPDINKELNENVVRFNPDSEEYTIVTVGDSEYDFLFSFEIENNGLSKRIIAIKQLIETNRFIKDHTIEEIYAMFIKLVIEAGIKIDLIHLEVILSFMMNFKDQTRAILSDPDCEMEYEINNVKQSIFFNSNSISKSLMFELVNKQLLSDELDSLRKNGSSILDLLIINKEIIEEEMEE